MSNDVLVVGSIAFDSVETPFGKREDALGGSGLFFSSAASYYSDVNLVAVVGEDYPQEPLDDLESRGVDIDGVRHAEGETFRWEGRYGYDLGDPDTLDTQLNVFGDFEPDLPEKYRTSEYVFLANIDPELQVEVLEQVEAPEFVALDTMNFWIDSKPEELKEAISRVDMVCVNETEARQFADEANVVQAAQYIQDLGPDRVAIKRGEYGSLLFDGPRAFFAPAYPLEEVFDPTGAGDTFAGGMLGFLAREGQTDNETLRQAMVIGGVMASFCVQEFSHDAIADLDDEDIPRRFSKFERLVDFDTIDSLP
jgi:sugar/nucleoside kinase (ribokinase family)